MYKVCNINLEQRGQIAEQIEQYCQEIVSKLDPQAIILFGSFATDDINEGSDIDIMVIADFQVGFLDRIKLLLDLNHFGLPIEPIGYTGEEFRAMKQARNPFLVQVLDTGKMMYQKRKSKLKGRSLIKSGTK
jgi:predicted nucleotidyltransferase